MPCRLPSTKSPEYLEPSFSTRSCTSESGAVLMALVWEKVVSMVACGCGHVDEHTAKTNTWHSEQDQVSSRLCGCAACCVCSLPAPCWPQPSASSTSRRYGYGMCVFVMDACPEFGFVSRRSPRSSRKRKLLQIQPRCGPLEQSSSFPKLRCVIFGITHD